MRGGAAPSPRWVTGNENCSIAEIHQDRSSLDRTVGHFDRSLLNAGRSNPDHTIPNCGLGHRERSWLTLNVTLSRIVSARSDPAYRVQDWAPVPQDDLDAGDGAESMATHDLGAWIWKAWMMSPALRFAIVPSALVLHDLLGRATSNRGSGWGREPTAGLQGVPSSRSVASSSRPAKCLAKASLNTCVSNPHSSATFENKVIDEWNFRSSG